MWHRARLYGRLEPLSSGRGLRTRGSSRAELELPACRSAACSGAPVGAALSCVWVEQTRPVTQEACASPCVASPPPSRQQHRWGRMRQTKGGEGCGCTGKIGGSNITKPVFRCRAAAVSCVVSVHIFQSPGISSRVTSLLQGGCAGRGGAPACAAQPPRRWPILSCDELSTSRDHADTRSMRRPFACMNLSCASVAVPRWTWNRGVVPAAGRLYSGRACGAASGCPPWSSAALCST